MDRKILEVVPTNSEEFSILIEQWPDNEICVRMSARPAGAGNFTTFSCTGLRDAQLSARFVASLVNQVVAKRKQDMEALCRAILELNYDVGPWSSDLDVSSLVGKTVLKTLGLSIKSRDVEDQPCGECRHVKTKTEYSIEAG